MVQDELKSSNFKMNWLQRAIFCGIFINSKLQQQIQFKNVIGPFHVYFEQYLWALLICFFLAPAIFTRRGRLFCVDIIVWICLNSIVTHNALRYVDVDHRAMFFSISYAYTCQYLAYVSSLQRGFIRVPLVYSFIFRFLSWVVPLFIAMFGMDTSIALDYKTILAIFSCDVISLLTDILQAMLQGLGKMYENIWF